jgi:hypothetical protein
MKDFEELRKCNRNELEKYESQLIEYKFYMTEREHR